MSAPPPDVAALFKRVPAAPGPSPTPAPPKPAMAGPGPSATISATSPPSNALFKSKPAAAFFDRLASTKAPAPVPVPETPPKPFVVPDLFKRALAASSAPTSTVDIRQAATEALTKTGWFDELPATTPAPEAARPFAGLSQGDVSGLAPSGLFKGIATAGPKKRGEPKPRVIKAGAKSLATLYGLAEEPEFRRGSKVADAKRAAGVSESPELNRILHIPRRPPPVMAPDTPDLTDEFRKPTGEQRLWKTQSAALHEARNQGGLLAPISVGGGKTLVSLLVGEAMGAKRIVLLVKPSLRSKLIDSDIPRLSRHWRLPLARMRIISYHQLSNAKTAEILEEIKPDLIVADEAHELRHRTAARTKRFLRYMKDHPECSFVGMSGTFTRRSLHDYQHLAELALRKHSPLPGNYGTLSEWADALDVSDDPMPPGALLQFANDSELQEIADIAGEGAMQTGTASGDKVQTIVRKAFQRRLVETPGVIATEETEVDASLTIEAHRPSVPGEVKAQLLDVRHRWEIDGEELVDPLTVARVLKQLAAGFRYKWKWPNDTPDTEWLEARRDWFREVREILKRSRKGLDSPLLIASACERGDFASDNYERWRKVKDRKPPPVEAIWSSDFLINAALAWANDPHHKPGIIWYTHSAVGQKLAEISGLPFFGPGAKASEELVTANPKKMPVIICSIAAHGTGKDLQPYTHHLVTTPPSGGVEWEQLLGRSHRPGQEADEVNFHVYVHTHETENAFRNAVRDASYIEQTTGQRQKLNYADRVGFDAKTFDFDPKSRTTPLDTEGLTWEGNDLQTLLRKSLKK